LTTVKINDALKSPRLVRLCRNVIACPPLAGVGGGRVNIAVMFSEVKSRQFFIHLRHCVTPPPAEDMGACPTTPHSTLEIKLV